MFAPNNPIEVGRLRAAGTPHGRDASRDTDHPSPPAPEASRSRRPALNGERTPRVDVDATLLLHYRDMQPVSSDVVDSYRSFRHYSRHPVFSVNTCLGFPPGLARLNFRAVLLHYTLFYGEFAPLTPEFREWIARTNSYLVAFFQDEQAYLADRIRFCDEYEVDCVYTLFEEPHASSLYGRKGRSVVTYIPGYVSENLRRAGERFALPHEERPIDVGYRGRRLPVHWGAAAREKYEIGETFRQRADGHGLVLDIESDESHRIYGSGWYEFLGRSKSTLGTEAGASIIDSNGLLPGSAHWEIDAEDDGNRIATELRDLEGRIPYRTISPRHLQAAALRSTQILFAGHYSGLLEPDTHYIALRKDFSNFEEVLTTLLDSAAREEIAENAYHDLIDSDDVTYRRFVAGVDRQLSDAGIHPGSGVDTKRIAGQLYPSRLRRRARMYWRMLKSTARQRVDRYAAKQTTDAGEA